MQPLASKTISSHPDGKWSTLKRKRMTEKHNRGEEGPDMPGLNGDGAGAGGGASPAPNSTTEAPRVKPPATDAPAPHPEPAVTDFLIRFSATHEEFRLPEILAIAEAEGIPLTVLEYTTTSPFCLVRLPGTAAAQRLIRRSILAQSIHEFWASGADLAALHAAMREHTAALWPRHATASFRILIDSFYGKRAQADRVAVINSFGYLPWRGAIRMADPDETFTVFEEWPRDARVRGLPDPDRLLFGRFVGTSARELVNRYDLKKRRYISTTSMDAELSLVTANLALAGPGKLVYDPFVGTGSFPLACAHFGATVFGSDIDGRSIRGRGADGRPGSGDPEQCLKANFTQYGLLGRFGDAFSADLTNSPICAGRRVFDAIVCDPPYGVREGLHVLGCRDPEKTPWAVEAGAKHWR